MSASGALSTRLRRLIISSVVVNLRFGLASPTRPYRRTRDGTAPPPAKAGGGATVELHHAPGHDPRPQAPGRVARRSRRSSTSSRSTADRRPPLRCGSHPPLSGDARSRIGPSERLDACRSTPGAGHSAHKLDTRRTKERLFAERIGE
jgi:hypothetical protein